MRTTIRTRPWLVCLVAGAAAVVRADPAPAPALPAATGRTAALRPCDSTDDCVARTACVRAGSASADYTCQPTCAADDDCRAIPGLTCQPVADASGRDYAGRVCGEARATLATMFTLHGAAPTGVAAWWDVGARMPGADVLRLRLGLRVPVLRDMVATWVQAAAQAAIAARLGALDLGVVRYSGFTPTVDRIGISRGARDTEVRVIVSGAVTAARERLVIGWSGRSWQADGTEDIAGYQAEVVASAAVTPGARLADQHLTLAIAPVSNSITIHVAPLDGTVIANAFSFDPPPPADLGLGAYVTGLPDRVQTAVVRWVRFGAIDDKEIVVEAKAAQP